MFTISEYEFSTMLVSSFCSYVSRLLANLLIPMDIKLFSIGIRSTKKNIFELCKYLKSMKNKSLLISLFLCTMTTGTFISCGETDAKPKAEPAINLLDMDCLLYTSDAADEED